MAILSVLKKGSVISQIAIQSLCKPKIVVPLKSSVRYGGSYDPRRMFIHPSRRSFQKFCDMMHFYFLLGLIPLGTLIFYINITVGPAQLRPIPEDYEPEHWEYHKHPIKRWFSKYIYASHQEEYERYLHFRFVNNRNEQMNLVQNRVFALRNRRQDSEDAPSFRRMPLNYIKMMRGYQDFKDEHGGKGDD